MTDFKYEERHDIDRPDSLSEKHRDFIQGIAVMEKALLTVTVGDRIEAETQLGSGVVGTVRKVNRGWPGNGNHVVLVDPDDPEMDSADVSIDYEGAFTSYFPYYLPYIVAGNDLKGLGEVVSLHINGRVVMKDAVDFENPA